MFTIDEIKEKAVPIAKKHGVDSLSLFGSYARGDQNEESDIDFLIDKGKITGFFSYYAMVIDLEEKFGKHVDLVTTGIEDKKFLNNIKSYAKELYVKN